MHTLRRDGELRRHRKLVGSCSLSLYVYESASVWTLFYDVVAGGPNGLLVDSLLCKPVITPHDRVMCCACMHACVHTCIWAPALSWDLDFISLCMLAARTAVKALKDCLPQG